MNLSIVVRPSIAIKAVFNRIPALIYRFVKPAIGSGPHWKISTDPRFFPYFENCLGAIDGTHIPVTTDPRFFRPTSRTA